MLNNIEVYQSVRNMYRHLIVNYSVQIWEMCFYFMLTNKFWYSNTSLYFLKKRTGQLWLFKKIIHNITYYRLIVITRICTCLRALYCWFKKQQLLLFAYNEQTQLLQKNGVVFLQIDIHDHLYLLLFDHSVKTYILCIKTIEMQKFTIALDRNSSVVNFRFVTPLKSKLKTAISGCVSLFPIFYISRSL